MRRGRECHRIKKPKEPGVKNSDLEAGEAGRASHSLIRAFILFKNFLIFILEREAETEYEQGRGREREGDTESEAKLQDPSCKHEA